MGKVEKFSIDVILLLKGDIFYWPVISLFFHSLSFVGRWLNIEMLVSKQACIAQSHLLANLGNIIRNPIKWWIGGLTPFLRYGGSIGYLIEILFFSIGYGGSLGTSPSSHPVVMLSFSFLSASGYEGLITWFC